MPQSAHYNFIMASGHVMKFVQSGRSEPQGRGIRTFPQHTYGVSSESPDHFKHSHTLVHHGYLYQHEHAPRFEYHSQKKSSVLAHQPPPHPDVHHDLHQNPHKFHLKKGRLTEFWDKNGWMREAYLMAGHERSQRSRSINNRDRDCKIKTLRPRIDYESEHIRKPVVNQDYYNTLEELMSERVRIRSRRNREAEGKVPLTQRALSELRVGEEGEAVKSRMAKTTREWYPTLKQKKMSRELSFQQPKAPEAELGFDTPKDDLEEWQRRTCNSKWCYRAPKDDIFDGIETQEML